MRLLRSVGVAGSGWPAGSHLCGAERQQGTKDPLDEKWLVKCGRKETVIPDVSISWLKNRYEVPQVSRKQTKSGILFSTNTIQPDDLAYEVQKFGLIDDIVQLFDGTDVEVTQAELDEMVKESKGPVIAQLSLF
jgi:hypothetical protein